MANLNRIVPILPVLVVAAVVWGLTLVDLGKSREAGAGEEGPVLLSAGAPAAWTGAQPARSSRFLTATDATAPAGPWAVERQGDSITVWAASGSRRSYRTVYRAQVPAGPLPEAFDVDRWGSQKAPALFSMQQTSERVRVTVYELNAEPRVLARGAALLPPPKNDRREFLVGTWSGTAADLFVIDGGRDQPRGSRPWILRIYSGESHFRNLILQIRLPERVGPRLSTWWLDLGRVTDGRPDLVLVSRDIETSTGQTEVHVLSGATQFQAFSLDAATALPQEPFAQHRFVYQRQGDAGAVLDLDLSSQRIQLQGIPLGG